MACGSGGGVLPARPEIALCSVPARFTRTSWPGPNMRAERAPVGRVRLRERKCKVALLRQGSGWEALLRQGCGG
jgi:hypothetical protein